MQRNIPVLLERGVMLNKQPDNGNPIKIRSSSSSIPIGEYRTTTNKLQNQDEDETQLEEELQRFKRVSLNMESNFLAAHKFLLCNVSASAPWYGDLKMGILTGEDGIVVVPDVLTSAAAELELLTTLDCDGGVVFISSFDGSSRSIQRTSQYANTNEQGCDRSV